MPGTISTIPPYFYGVNEAGSIVPTSRLWKAGNRRLRDWPCEEAKGGFALVSCLILVWFRSVPPNQERFFFLPPGKSGQSLETFLIFMTKEEEGY